MSNLKTVSLEMKKIFENNFSCIYCEIDKQGNAIDKGRKIKIAKKGAVCSVQQLYSFTCLIGNLITINNEADIDIYQCGDRAMLVHHSGDYIHYCECQLSILFSIVANEIKIL